MSVGSGDLGRGEVLPSFGEATEDIQAARDVGEHLSRLGVPDEVSSHISHLRLCGLRRADKAAVRVGLCGEEEKPGGEDPSYLVSGETLTQL